MRAHTTLAFLLALCLTPWNLGLAADSPAGSPAKPIPVAELDKLAGQPVDIAPWAYVWRSDHAVQEKPEAYFIPRRLDRINKVYRTAATALSPQQLKSSNYANQPDMLKPFPPQPKGRLLTGLLWTGGLHDYKVELHWPAGLQEIPPPDAVDVRVYPTAWGWFGWTVDTILRNPHISADRRTWTYKSDPAAKMDFSYNNRVDAATEMVAVFCEQTTQAAPYPPCQASASPAQTSEPGNAWTWRLNGDFSREQKSRTSTAGSSRTWR